MSDQPKPTSPTAEERVDDCLRATPREDDHRGGFRSVKYFDAIRIAEAHAAAATAELREELAEAQRLRACCETDLAMSRQQVAWAHGERDASRAEVARLREIEHALWHLLDDSEERMDEAFARTTVLAVDRKRYEALSALLPEECPAALAGAAEPKEPKIG